MLMRKKNLDNNNNKKNKNHNKQIKSWIQSSDLKYDIIGRKFGTKIRDNNSNNNYIKS